ncbi:MAG: 3-hydroxyisobutyrate dehydrogenase [Fulvimarina sp.]|nr:3-hydroxyisobutyrate dehydrogenase [Fulvimarina sp.]
MTQVSGRIAIIGFGEAGRTISAGWPVARDTLAAFDIKTAASETREAMAARCREAGISGCPSAADALAGAGTVFCLVTADQAVVAAREASASLVPGALWFDGNSCSPDSKREAAAIIEAAGGRYVDMAIMAPVHPKGHRVPILIAGPHAEAGLAVLAALDMNASVAGLEVGQASAIKMLRSVMIKGLEALTAECILAARRAGVEDQVLASLQASDPGFDWQARSSYNLERMTAHGSRRAAEMEEVEKTVAALGLPPRMSAAIAAWQRQIGALGLVFEGEDPAAGDRGLAARADALLNRL